MITNVEKTTKKIFCECVSDKNFTKNAYWISALSAITHFYQQIILHIKIYLFISDSTEIVYKKLTLMTSISVLNNPFKIFSI